VKVFTNGCVSPELLSALKRILVPNRTMFLVNVNQPAQRTDGEDGKQQAFFETFSGLCGLSCNIYEPGMDFGFLIDHIERYKLRRKIRMGLAHPLVGEPNSHLDTSSFPEVARRIVEFVSRCDRHGITVSLDCGFTLCDFTDEQLGIMTRAQTSMKFICDPIIDIGPDLRIWACLPLSNVAPRPLAEFSDMTAAIVHFRELVNRVTDRHGFYGLYPECRTCKYRQRGTCVGGYRTRAFTGDGQCSSATVVKKP